MELRVPANSHPSWKEDLLQFYKKGTRVWLPNSEETWDEGVIATEFDSFHIGVKNIATDELINVTVKQCLPSLMNPPFQDGIDDLTRLTHLNEPGVLSNLNYRFSEMRNIYTYCGIVLIAVNPFESTGHLYGDEVIRTYHSFAKDVRQADPHIYAVAQEAFFDLKEFKKNQVIIVSGESGAGKTVNAKYAMRFFATVATKSKRFDDIESRLLSTNVLLEALGNAKTSRNDNSSRFGKFVQINFDDDLAIASAEVKTYLLEKSRLAHQSPGERNYHVFYQMCKSREHEVLRSFELDRSENYHYLNQGGDARIPGVDDREEFSALLDSLTAMGLSSSLVHEMFGVLTAVLTLGNVEFTGVGDSSSITEKGTSALHKFCDLLGVANYEKVYEMLVSKKLRVAGTEIKKDFTKLEAERNRDAFAKLIYSRLFNYMVAAANDAIAGNYVERGKKNFVGVLDIYGFETFDINSFEQFSINYANEKLQQHFCTHIFKLEQEEYEREGINWSRIEFSDNQETIDLIEGRLGLINLLDEQSKLVNGSDDAFLQQAKSMIKSSKLEYPKTKRDQFSVKHFASDVAYTIHGFLEKNKDEVSADLKDFVAASIQKIPLGKLILDKDYSQTVVNAKGKKTVAGAFYLSLQELMKTLSAARPHYVRCVKPNDYKESFSYQGNRVLPQLRACGVLETVRISAAGYPSRLPYDRFVTRYRCLVPDWWIKFPRNSKPQHIPQALCIAEKIDLHEQIACGKTQVFMKTGHIARFEDERTNILSKAAISIQSRWKGFLAKRRYENYRNNIRIMQATCRAYMAYRRIKFLQMHRAAIVLQANIRGFLQRKKYQSLKTAVLAIQSAYRGRLVRDKIRRQKYEKSVVTIQRYWRGYLVRREEIRRRRKIVKVQACVRRWLAKRRLRELKIEARSVNHLQSANRGLENKIIMLQFRLDAALLEKKDLEKITTSQKENIKAMEDERKALLEARKKIEQLEAENERLATDLDVKEGEISSLQNKFVSLEAEKEKVLADYALASCLASTELNREKELKQELTTKLTEVQKQCSNEERARKVVELEIQKMRDQLLANANLLASPTLTKPSTVQKEETPSGQVTDIALIVRQQAMISELRQKWESAVQRLRRTELLNETARLLDTLSADSALESYDQETVSSIDGFSLKIGRQSIRRSRHDPFENEENMDVEYLAKELSMAKDEIAGLRALLVRYNQENRSGGGSPRPDSGAGSEVETDTDRLPDISTQLCLLKTIKQLKNLLWATGKELYKLHAETKAQEYLDVPMHSSENGSMSKSDMEMRLQKLSSENMDLTQKVLSQGENLREAYEKLRESVSGSEPSGSEISQKTGDTGIVVPHSAKLKVTDLPELTHILVFDLKPRVARIITKNFPAYLLLTACRYFDKDESRLAELCQNFHTKVKERIAGSTDLDILSMWLVNSWSFLNLLRQYGGTGAVWPAEWHKQNTEIQNNQRVGCDVSSQVEQVRHLVEETYRALMKTAVQPILEPKIVPGVLQHESTDGLMPRKKSIDGKDTKKYLSDLLEFMSFIHAKLAVYGADHELLRHVFRQMANWISTLALNQLMFRKDLCTFEKAIQIKHNVMEVQNWLQNKGFPDLRPCLEPLVQACHLLQSRKDESNLDTICGEMTDLLKPRQVVAILQHYTPGQDFEERNIDPKFLITVQKRLVEREIQMHGSDKEKDALILAGTFVAPIGDVPFTYSDFQLEMLTLPSALYLTHCCQMLPKED